MNVKKEIKKKSCELTCIWVSGFLEFIHNFSFHMMLNMEEFYLHNIKLNISIYIIKFNFNQKI